jgi:hypothetical protein
VELVEEPVNVEEWGGKLVENECWAVEVEEGSLRIDDTVSYWGVNKESGSRNAW